MKAIEHRQVGLKGQKRKGMRVVLVGLGVLVGIFVGANLVMSWLYRGKVLPNYWVAAVPVGDVPFDQLDQRVAVDDLIPKRLTLTKGDKKQEVTLQDLGAAVDWAATRQQLRHTRSWLPMVSLLVRHTVPAELTLDNARFAAAAQDQGAYFKQAALPERIVFDGQNFTVAAPKAGYTLDAVKFRLDVVQSLGQGEATLTVPTITTTAPAPTGKLTSQLTALQKQLDANITLKSGSHSKQITRADIGRFYESTGQTMQLSAADITRVMEEVAKAFGITPINQNDAGVAASYAIAKSQPVTFVLADASTKVRHYCTAVRGVDASVLPEYRQKLAAVYGDPRGWNQAGVTLVYAQTGCDYTAWLSAPDAMASFGGVCDSYYSCRSGADVVVNYDRWKGATDPWNKAGGSLEDYRAMVINHETGHWLGFGHRTCPGPGQPAPVMQQQSISLQGCIFNPWPTPAEVDTLKATLGLAATHDPKHTYALASTPCSCGHCTG